MNEEYSRTLSDAARAALVDFVESYVAQGFEQRATALAEHTKQKAVECLRDTDIDILVFTITAGLLTSPGVINMMYAARESKRSARDTAETVVAIVEVAAAKDKRARKSGGN